MIRALLAVLLLATAPAPMTGQVVRKFGLRTPMRDGAQLVADLWLPAGHPQSPVILIRTPYVRNAEAASLGYPALAEYFVKHGYGFMVQDVRGRGDSDGEFDFFFQEEKDGYDTVEWIAAQPWSNGKVGMMGVSYLGTVQWLAARAKPPHLACIAPTAPAGKYLEELPSVGGAFGLQWALRWLTATSDNQMQGGNLEGTDWNAVLAHRPLISMDSVLLGRPLRLFREFLTHQTLDDYWRRIRFGPADFASIDIPTMTTTGWFDGDQAGALYYWRGIKAHSPRTKPQFLVAGPWTHVQTFIGGDLAVEGHRFTPDARIDNKAYHRAFFDYCLKGEPVPDWPRARVYLTGSNRWVSLDDYPPETRETSVYLRSGGKANSLRGDGRLSFEAPGAEPADRYRYDPKNPVPTDLVARDPVARKTGDHRVVERRDDVLVYSSPVLTRPIDVVGAVAVELFATTDARDTDWVVKLIDVQPDGRALKLGINGVAILRARYRNGIDREELLTPGKSEKYRIEIYDVAHTFQPGHRIRLEVTSSFAPFFNPNQNTGNPIATDTSWVVANQQIHHDRERPSRLILPVFETRAAAKRPGAGGGR